MNEPTGSSGDAQVREALREQSDAARRLDTAWMEQRQDAYLAPQAEEPVVLPERLFSRKVLFGWAFAALLFVFIIRMVLPVAFETAKETFVSSMKESMHTPAGPVVAPTPPAPPTPTKPAVTPAAKPTATTVQSPPKKSPR